MSSPVARRRSGMALCVAGAWMLLSGCNGDNGTPVTPTATTTTTTATTTTSASLRVTNLSQDARTIDVTIDGARLFQGIRYAAVSSYQSLDRGEHRVQFFQSGSRSPALRELVLSVAAGETVTLNLVGLDMQAVPIRDDLRTNATRARVRFFNAVPDFPAGFDLAVSNGPVLAGNVTYPAASEYLEVIPGVYDLEIRRAGTREVIARPIGASLLQSSTYTVFAIGALRRGKISLFVAHDSQ